jgi:hypothetical protein
MSVLGSTPLWAIVAFAATSCSPKPDCNPPPGSCDGPAPSMYAFDALNVCLKAAAPVPVCDTSVNRCAPSMGLGPVCAFAPDGTIYFETGSDNAVLTQPGWRFDQPYGSYGDAGASYPPDEVATPDDHTKCVAVTCAPPCPGVSAPSRVAWCP